VWALGVFDYVSDPNLLVQTMVRLSGRLVAASFRRIWVVRYPFRKLLYELRGIPVHFFRRGEIEGLLRKNGVIDVRVERIDRAMYLATGRVVK